MIIRGYQLQRFSLALRRPLRTASSEFHAREGVTLMLRTDRHAGLGECTPLVEFGGAERVDDSARAIVEACEWVMDHATPDEVAELDTWIDSCEWLRDRPASRHAVECALLDLLARERGVPLRTLLHDRSASSISVNALLSAQSAIELAREGSAAKAAGFGTVKVKVGAQPFAVDVERLGTLRAVVGPAMKIRIDANGAWARDEAVEKLRALSEFGIELCEQPAPAADPDALAHVRNARICAVAADEVLLGARTLTGLLDVADVFVLRPMVMGGLLRTVRAAWAAKAAGAGAYVASSLEGTVGRAAASHAAAAFPEASWAHGLATGSLFVGEVNGILTPVNGRIELDGAPGLGLAPRRAA